MTVIALLQLNPTVGDISGNVTIVEAAAAMAAEAGADMAVASELVISGYPPRDMLMDATFVTADRKEISLASFRGTNSVVIAFYIRAFTGG